MCSPQFRLNGFKVITNTFWQIGWPVSRQRLQSWLLALVLGPGLGLSPASADVVILGSDVQALAPGHILKDADDLVVPAGGTIRIMTPSGKTEVLKGPLNRKAGELTAGGGEANTELWNAVTAQLGDKSAPAAGAVSATRSMAAPTETAGAFKFSWSHIPISATGDICVGKGIELGIVRLSDGAAQAFTLVDLQSGGRRADLAFAAGETSVAWPSEIEPRLGNFALQVAGESASRFKLRLIAPLPSAADAIRVLHGQRCAMQRDALLDAMKDPTFQISALSE